MSFATEGKELFYGAVRNPFILVPWRINDNDIGKLGLGEIKDELIDLLSPERLLDILKNFSLFTTNKKNKDQKLFVDFSNMRCKQNC